MYNAQYLTVNKRDWGLEMMITLSLWEWGRSTLFRLLLIKAKLKVWLLSLLSLSSDSLIPASLRCWGQLSRPVYLRYQAWVWKGWSWPLCRAVHAAVPVLARERVLPQQNPVKDTDSAFLFLVKSAWNDTCFCYCINVRRREIYRAMPAVLFMSMKTETSMQDQKVVKITKQ